MNCSISSIYYCPVKTLSFQSIESCNVEKELGMINDRIFAFSRGVDLEKANSMEANPNDRKLINLLTLKNSPALNKYNFTYKEGRLSLNLKEKEIISISPDNNEERIKLSEKLIELESSLAKPIFLLKNTEFPFFDTTHSNNIFNSISLINLNTVRDFEKKINEKVEFERFRGNFYFEGLDAGEERNWIGKIIKINNVSFKVEKNIPRCVAINLKPKTDDNSLNLLQSLKKSYNTNIITVLDNSRCFNRTDLGVLQEIINENKSLAGKEPLGIGKQSWKDRRLIYLYLDKQSLTKLPSNIGDLKNIEVYNLTEVQANEVLVIESKFGKAPAFKETSDDEILSVPLVKDRSYRGIVNEAFASGFYAIHPRTEQPHKVSIVLETFIYGGGYIPVTMDLEIDPENDKLITKKDNNGGKTLPEQKNGGAFTAKTKDNHTVRYDVRVLGQIEPVQAPRFIGTIRDPKSLDDKVIEPFTKNILSNLTLEYNALELKDKKKEIGQRVSEILRERTIKTGFRTKTVEITNIDIPAIVLIPGKIESASTALKQALEEKEKSVEQAIKVRNMQDQADNQEELAKQTVKNQAADQEAERITKLAEANKTKAQLEADAKAYAVNQQTEANKKRIEETAQAFGVLANILGEDNATKILLQETINEKASEFQTPDVLVIGAGADQGAAIVNSHMISQSIGQSVDKAVTKPVVKPVAATQTTNSN